jgi:hypothetical protein
VSRWLVVLGTVACQPPAPAPPRGSVNLLPGELHADDPTDPSDRVEGADPADRSRQVDPSHPTDAAAASAPGSGPVGPGALAEAPPTTGSRTLTNLYPQCINPGQLRGADDERGHLAVTRFQVPPGFQTREVRVQIVHIPGIVEHCVSPASVEVVAFTGRGPVPPASPTWTSVTGSPVGVDVVRTVTVPLSIAVPPGDQLFVGLRLEVGSDGATCVRTCSDYVDNDVTFWSHARNAPFAWRALEDHVPSFVADLAIEVDGS